MKQKIQQLIPHLPDMASSLLWGCLSMYIFDLFQAFHQAAHPAHIHQLMSQADRVVLKMDINANSVLVMVALFLYIFLLFSKRYSLWSVLEVIGFCVLPLLDIISMTPILKYGIGVLYFTRVSYKLSKSMDQRDLKGIGISLIQLIFPYPRIF